MAKDISIKRLATYWPLYFFVLPSALMVATFSYFPAGSAIYHSAFRWNMQYIKLFVGAANFQKALGTPVFWIATLLITMTMIYTSQKKTPLAVGVKWICGFGFPLLNLALFFPSSPIEPATPLRWLLPIVIWGGLIVISHFRMDEHGDGRGLTFFMLGFLGVFSTAMVGLESYLALSLTLVVMGMMIWLPMRPFTPDTAHLLGMRITHAIVGVGAMVWSLALNAGGDPTLWSGFSVIAALVVANLVKMVPSITTAVVINRLKSDAANYWYRVLFVVPMIIPGMVYLLIWKFFFQSDGLFNLVLRKTGIMHLLYLYDKVTQNGVFLDAARAAEMSISQVFAAASEATPAWLGMEELVLPAFILWGFPWVGVVGVLIYLAGLQSIDSSVYEAADLDGVGAFGKFLNIELPLILTQVRINLVLMIIGTLQTYGMILVLLGDAGGPNGRMMVPGLLMYRSAFVETYAGYACSIGLILFFLILVLTEINNRFVRVEK